MKRLMTAAIALSLLSGSAAMAQPHNNDRHDSRNERHDNGRHNGWDKQDNRHDVRPHRWARGERLPSQYRSRGYYVDYRSHHLRAPPRGYQWVQRDNDYLLVALTTGLIASIVASSH